MKELPRVERIRELLAFNPATGELTWCVGRQGVSREKNGRAGTKSSFGYLRIYIDGQQIMAHRIVWLLTHGVWPTKDIDHINCDRSDNRPENLREATRSENLANSNARRNRSGFKGVDKKGRKWRATIRKNGVIYRLGLFPSAETASLAYRVAAKELYGEFARSS